MDDQERFPYVCPRCEAHGTAPTTYLGRTVTCPKCKTRVKISSDGKISAADQTTPSGKDTVKDDVSTDNVTGLPATGNNVPDVYILIVHRPTKRAFTLNRNYRLLQPLIENVVIPPDPKGVEIGRLPSGDDQVPSWATGLDAKSFTVYDFELDHPPMIVTSDRPVQDPEDATGDGRYMTSLHVAAEKGSFKEAKRLLAKGSDADARNYIGQTPLHFAAANGHINIVRLLSEHKADFNAQDLYGKPPLYAAVEAEQEQVVQLLLEHRAVAINATTKDRDGTALYEAVGLENQEIVGALLGAGANSNAVSYGETPLHWAAQCSSQEIVDLLVCNGASVNARDVGGETPLHRAAARTEEALVDFLLLKGADVNATSKDMITPLHEAAREGRRIAAAVLLANGANPDAQSKFGFTPLHEAVEHCKKNIVGLLVSHMADVNATLVDGRTALDLTHGDDEQEIKAILRKHGAKSGREMAQNG